MVCLLAYDVSQTGQMIEYSGEIKVPWIVLEDADGAVIQEWKF